MEASISGGKGGHDYSSPLAARRQGVRQSDKLHGPRDHRAMLSPEGLTPLTNRPGDNSCFPPSVPAILPSARLLPINCRAVPAKEIANLSQVSGQCQNLEHHVRHVCVSFILSVNFWLGAFDG